MGIEFFKTSIPVNGKTDDVIVQTAAEGDIIIPDSKPDIAEALITDAYAVIRDEKAGDGRMSYGGDIKVNLLYRAKNGENPIYAVKASIPFMDFVNADSIRKGEKPDLRLSLTDIRTTVVNDRKVNIRALGEARLTGALPESREIVGGAEQDGAIQILDSEICCFVPIAAVRMDFTAEDNFNIQSNMQPIGEALRETVKVTESEFKPAEDKVTVRGAILISILYCAPEGSFTEKAEFKMPFSASINIPGVTGESVVWGDVYVNDYDIKYDEDDDGSKRTAEVTAQIRADIRAGENKCMTAVKDIYSIKGKAEVKRENDRYPERGVFTSAAENVREIITIDSSYPDILQIKDVSAGVETEDIHINGDIITVNGALNINMLYVTRDDSEPIKAVATAIPFEHEIEVRGLYEDAEIDISATVSDLNYSLISDREAEIRAIIDYSVFSLMDNSTEFVASAEIDEETEIRSLPGITIYTVKKGDTLWNIAKNFNTALNDILSVNLIENPDAIYPGQRILILKRR